MSKDIDVSVVIIHGIGDQDELETLTEAVDAISKWVDVKSGTLGKDLGSLVTVNPDALSDRDQWSPRHAVLDIGQHDSVKHIPPRWLVAEAWWAKSFPEPTKDELLSWLIQFAPSLLVKHLSNREDQVSAEPEDVFWLEKWLLVPIIYALALPISMLALIVIALLYAISAIPIRGIDEIALRTQRALSARLGDSFVFVSSKGREALIKKEVRRTIDWAREKSPNVLLVAHSQGAAVTFEILHEDIENRALDGAEKENRTRKSDAEDKKLTFITLGQGISKLMGIRELLNEQNASLGAAAVISFTAAAVWLGVVMRIEADAFWGTFSSGAPAVLAIFHPVLLLVALYVLMMKVAAAGARAKSVRPWLRRWLIVVTLTIIFGLLYILSNLRLDMAILYGFGILLLLCLAVLGLSSAECFSKKVNNIEKVASDYRWIDVYSAMDPVSNGPVLTPEERTQVTAIPEPRLINNRRSTITDHTTYWSNIEEFASIVMQAAAAACAKDKSEKEDEYWRKNVGITEGDENKCQPRNQRLRRLAIWRWCLIGSWVAILIAAPGETVKGLVEWGQWTEDAGVSPELLSNVLFGFLLYGLYIIIAASWEIWNAKEVSLAAGTSEDVYGARRIANVTEYGSAILFLVLSFWLLKAQLPDTNFLWLDSASGALDAVLSSLQ